MAKIMPDDKYYLPIMVGCSVSFAVMLYHLFYNNLLINLRFKIKIESYNFGKYFAFDVLNYLMCYFCLLKPCRDRCCTPWTIVKWVILTPAYIALAYLVWEWKSFKVDFLHQEYQFDLMTD